MTSTHTPDGRLGRATLLARLGAVCYVAWGLFHVRVAWDILQLGLPATGLTQARLFQLSAYMLTLSLFVIAVAALRNWRNDRLGYWLNLCVAGWADAIWVVVVVAPGYVDPVRGLAPPAVFIAGAVFSTLARRSLERAGLRRLPTL